MDHTNRLASESSPYLLQHAHNPVDWYPWGEEAFRAARDRDLPVFLSIGYSTCHWCHVMERECFEDPEVAVRMNETFVSIKVDREERPDLDEHFMTICQLLTGSGGWPMTIILTPDGKPFFAGTYIPKNNAYGRMGMMELAPRIGKLWKDQRADVEASADSIGGEIQRALAPETRDAGPGEGGAAGPGGIRAEAVATAAAALAARFDEAHGGFGSAPKFPMAGLFPVLLRHWKRSGDARALAMVEQSLLAMRNGGVYDQVGFGFHRYSTDEQWLVPHFEKMLYDQALLTLAYVEAWQATGNEVFARTAKEILTYVSRDMTSPEGGFCSAEDADSEGEEGRFYVWTAAEVEEALGHGDAAAAGKRYRLDEGRTGILHRDPSDRDPPGPLEERLLQARSARARPFRDDKILADWNGLMIAAFARAGAALDDPALVRAAERAADFVLGRMTGTDGRLQHRYRGGQAGIHAFADDYAFLSWGLIELAEAASDEKRLAQAAGLVDQLLSRFQDEAGGGFYRTASDAPRDTARAKPITDGSIPCANSIALLVLARLAEMTGEERYRRAAERVVLAYPSGAAEQPFGFSYYLVALDFLAGPAFQLAISGDPMASDAALLRKEALRRFLPNKVLLVGRDGYPRVEGRAAAYVCQGFACNRPTTDVSVMLSQLGAG